MSHLNTTRHMELFDPHKFNTPVTIIGAGATGSWLALALAKLGIEDITIYDFDVVEEHNIPNQAYDLFGWDRKLGALSQHEGDVGSLKVRALRSQIELATGTEIKIFEVPFTNQRVAGIVFLMVDSMKVRKEIWENSLKMKTAVQLVVEPRMGLDVGRVYNVIPTDVTHIKKYEETYSYGDDTAEVSACGASKTVITSALGIASWCARQLINFHNGEELDNEILIDFKFNNLVTERW